MMFDKSQGSHQRIAALAAEVESELSIFELPATLHFAAQRRKLREWMKMRPAAQEIERLVAELLDASVFKIGA